MNDLNDVQLNDFVLTVVYTLDDLTATGWSIDIPDD